jgi:hypothetical protein
MVCVVGGDADPSLRRAHAVGTIMTRMRRRIVFFTRIP